MEVGEIIIKKDHYKKLLAVVEAAKELAAAATRAGIPLDATIYRKQIHETLKKLEI